MVARLILVWHKTKIKVLSVIIRLPALTMDNEIGSNSLYIFVFLSFYLYKDKSSNYEFFLLPLYFLKSILFANNVFGSRFKSPFHGKATPFLMRQKTLETSV